MLLYEKTIINGHMKGEIIMFKRSKKDRKFIVNEKDVTAVVTVVNKHRRSYEIETNNCGWADEPEKWFIAFEACDEEYGHIVDELNKLGKFSLNVSPSFVVVSLYYERVH